MNRNSHRRPLIGNQPAAKTPKAPKFCAFCGASTAQARFSALSKRKPTYIICNFCIKQFARMSKFSELDVFGIYYQQKPDYSALAMRVGKSLAGESATARMRRFVVRASIFFVQRASSIIAGHSPDIGAVCPITRVPLEPPRLALVGKDSLACGKLFSVASGVTGLPVVMSSVAEAENGTGFKMLTVRCNGQETWAAHTGVLVIDGYSRTADVPCSMIFACSTSQNFAADVQVINVDGFEGSELS